MGNIKLGNLLAALEYNAVNTEVYKNTGYENIDKNDGKKNELDFLDIEISDIVYDSRKVSAGCAFVCIRGARFDSHDILDEVIQKGALAVFVEHDIKKAEIKDIKPSRESYIIKVENTRYALAVMSAEYFGRPADKLISIGVTGTKGKTTTAHMIKKLLESAGKKTGMIGTNGVYTGSKHIPLVNTTPQSYDLHRYLNMIYEDGCKYVVMEVSSQGLKLDRTAGIVFDYAVFTNISPDHIGPAEHENFDEYLYYKSTLFYKQCRHAIINIDDINGKKIYENIVHDKIADALSTCKKSKIKAYSFGKADEADFRLCGINYLAEKDFVGISCIIKTPQKEEISEHDEGDAKLNVNVGIPGRFNALNATAAAAVAFLLDVNRYILENALINLHVDGRMEVVYKSDKYIVIVDYAHNAVSMESLLDTLRDYNPKRLVVVFGCGGNRSKDRRYSMGEIAGKKADLSIITADNSRFEKVEGIIADIRKSIEKTGGKFIEIPDRQEAISYAVENALKGDIIAVIGKGHEDYQEINGIRHHFLDREAVMEALKK